MSTSTIILVLIVSSSHFTQLIEKHYPMPDLSTCQRAVAEAKIEVSPGNENEQAIAMFCALANERGKK
jgi:hypothetical protein